MNENTKALDWEKTTAYEEVVDLLQFQNRAVRRYCKKHKCDIDEAIEALYGNERK